MRRIALPLIWFAMAAACGGHPALDASPSAASDVTPSSTSPTASAVTPSAPPPTPALPSGVPATYGHDVGAGDVPLAALIPPGATLDGSWYATLPVGEAIVVAYEEPSKDPFRAARGLVVWRRFDATPPWRATFGVAYRADEGVLSIGALVADVTGDGSPDALVMESTGGSGSCASYRVLDLAGGTQVWQQDTLCDAQVVPSTDPTGLRMTEAVYKQADAHCCPSATRTTVLVYAGGAKWTVASRKVTPTG